MFFASTILSISISIMVNCIEAHISFMLFWIKSKFWLFIKFLKLVLSPEKLKFKPSTFGFGNLNLLKSPFDAKLSILGPAGNLSSRVFLIYQKLHQLHHLM